jgi:arylsulfatase A-like enzyme
VHYEESMRVPFLVRWPSRIKPRRDPLLLSSPDIYPTLLDLMGFAADIPPDVQGVSHAVLFLTGQGERPTSQLYLQVPVGQPAWGRRGLRTDRYTFVVAKKPGAPVKTVLHDNRSDPYQLENVADQRPEIVKQLTEELERWLRKNHDPWLQS